MFYQHPDETLSGIPSSNVINYNKTNFSKGSEYCDKKVYEVP